MSARVLVLGGGPAGAAAAIGLARAGLPHLLVERTRETGDALCGGFLSWRSLDSLAALGIDREALGGATVRRVRLFAGGRSAEARLPRPACGVSRRRLDTLMLAQAVACGAAVERGVAAAAVEHHGVRLRDGTRLDGAALFLASGKHDVRGAARDAVPADDPSLGLRTRLGPAPALAALVGDAVELHLFRGGYAGVVMQEDGTANACLAVRRSRLAAAGSPAALLAQLGAENPPLGERIGYGTAATDAVANVPYGWRASVGTSGLFRLGDQAGVIPSLAGEGMGIAIESGRRAAAAYAAGGAAASIGYQHRLARDLAGPLGIAGVVRALGDRPHTAQAMLGLARIAPALMQIIARSTRIAHAAG